MVAQYSFFLPSLLFSITTKNSTESSHVPITLLPSVGKRYVILVYAQDWEADTGTAHLPDCRPDVGFNTVTGT